MAYIGKTPVIGNFQKCDSISVVNGQAAYTLQVGGVNVSPQSENHMLVSLNGILQAPVDSFTVSGSTLTFASNLVTGDVIDFVMILGNVLDLGVPSDNTVSLAKLTATGTKSSSTFLRGDNSFASAGITEADQWRLTAAIVGTDADITANLERIDGTGQGTLGTGMTESSGIFTFPSTGIWLVNTNIYFSFGADADAAATVQTKITVNNSTYTDSAQATGSQKTGSATNMTNGSSIMVDVTDTANVKVKFTTVSLASTSQVYGATNDTNYTSFTFIRLGDT